MKRKRWKREDLKIKEEWSTLRVDNEVEEVGAAGAASWGNMGKRRGKRRDTGDNRT